MFIVYATYRNSDMTEGKGPMILDKVFTQATDANAYIMKQDGVMGRTPYQFGKNSWESLGDWRVKPLVVLESLNDSEKYEYEQHRKSALAKLTQAEKDALGL